MQGFSCRIGDQELCIIGMIPGLWDLYLYCIAVTDIDSSSKLCRLLRILMSVVILFIIVVSSQNRKLILIS